MEIREGGASARSGGSGGPVLIVDDDEDIRETVSDILSSAGYVCATACNGREALDRARARRPALVLLDLNMPVMNGWQFRQEQLADPDLAAIPVVVMTAARNIDPKAAPGPVLSKPMAFDKLLKAVERALRTPGPGGRPGAPGTAG
jgi:CheY-like chemotaxis protein